MTDFDERWDSDQRLGSSFFVRAKREERDAHRSLLRVATQQVKRQQIRDELRGEVPDFQASPENARAI